MSTQNPSLHSLSRPAPPTHTPAPPRLSFLGWNQISVVSKNLSAPLGSTPGSQLKRLKNKQTFRAEAWPGAELRRASPPPHCSITRQPSLPWPSVCLRPYSNPQLLSCWQNLIPTPKLQDRTSPNLASRQVARLGARREVSEGFAPSLRAPEGCCFLA